MPYHWQAVDHDASISVERDPADDDQIIVEINVGDHAMARIAMWAEQFEHMTQEVLDV